MTKGLDDFFRKKAEGIIREHDSSQRTAIARLAYFTEIARQHWDKILKIVKAEFSSLKDDEEIARRAIDITRGAIDELYWQANDVSRGICVTEVDEDEDPYNDPEFYRKSPYLGWLKLEGKEEGRLRLGYLTDKGREVINGYRRIVGQPEILPMEDED